MSKNYLKTRRFKVSQRQFTTLRKSYQLSRLEKVSISRRLFFIWLPIGAGLLGLHWMLGDLLYDSEIMMIRIVVALLTVLTWFTGALVIESKALNECAAYGLYGDLRRVKAAIDKATEKNLSGSYDHE